MFRIVRNDITKMNTEAIVNTANAEPKVGAGCDTAVYKAAGYDELLAYRRENIGVVNEGDVFITPGFNLSAKYIIHAVSPRYEAGSRDAEAKLRACYRKSLELAKANQIKSIAFPLISTGSFKYPKEEGMRIAVDEINAFMLNNKHDNIDIFLVVFCDETTALGEKLVTDLEEYIDQNYVDEKLREEYEYKYEYEAEVRHFAAAAVRGLPKNLIDRQLRQYRSHTNKIDKRMQRLPETFSQCLMSLIRDKNMNNAEVYKRAIVDKKIFSKIKNNVNYHPQKLTALCLCIGAKLNLDEAKDLLARAGYALSPCDKTDVIFSYFIENEIYDMIELDIQLEKHGLPCIIA